MLLNAGNLRGLFQSRPGCRRHRDVKAYVEELRSRYRFSPDRDAEAVATTGSLVAERFGLTRFSPDRDADAIATL